MGHGRRPTPTPLGLSWVSPTGPCSFWKLLVHSTNPPQPSCNAHKSKPRSYRASYAGPALKDVAGNVAPLPSKQTFIGFTD
eukprot:759376-Hanusia_phi.AAC.1